MDTDQILAISFASLFLLSLAGCIVYVTRTACNEKKQDVLLEV